MNWIKDINCCHVAIAGLIAHIVGLVIVGRYVMKIKYKEAQLELRTKELEKKNGSEMKRIEKLEKQIKELERRS